MDSAQKKAQEQELLAKREIRRKRRKRNQMLAYMGLLVFVVLLVGAVACTVIYLGEQSKARKASNASVEADIDNLVGTEETLVKPDPTEMAPEQTPEQKLDEIINAAINVMPIEDKVAGLFIVTPESITGVNKAIKAGDGTREALNTWAVGGVIYFKQNIQSAEQFTEMISNTSLYSRYPLFVGIDEEGGSVSRLAEAGLAQNVGSAQTIGASGDPTQAYAAYSDVAGYLSSYGFNLDFAPVADINNVEDSVIGDRAYGSDSTVVASMVASAVQGLEENGVSACLKHFPELAAVRRIHMTDLPIRTGLRSNSEPRNLLYSKRVLKQVRILSWSAIWLHRHLQAIIPPAPCPKKSLPIYCGTNLGLRALSLRMP